MTPAIWFLMFLPLFLILMEQHQAKKREKQRHIRKAIKVRKMKGGIVMTEIIKRFIGKDCIITTMSENVTAKIEAVEDNWIVVSPVGKSGGTEIINIDYISRIREFPTGKNGKKKAIVT